MIPVRKLVTSVRYATGDMQGAGVSDFEIIEAVNRAAELLFHRLGARFVHVAVKKEVLTIEDGSVSTSLPGDFQSVKRVTEEGREADLDPATGRVCPVQYRIYGETFLARPGVYGLEYYYIPWDVENLTDELDAPPSLSPWLEQMAVLTLKGDVAGAAAVAENCCDALAAGEFSHLTRRGPVQVLGGRL